MRQVLAWQVPEDPLWIREEMLEYLNAGILECWLGCWYIKKVAPYREEDINLSASGFDNAGIENWCSVDGPFYLFLPY